MKKAPAQGLTKGPRQVQGSQELPAPGHHLLSLLPWDVPCNIPLPLLCNGMQRLQLVQRQHAGLNLHEGGAPLL